MSVVDVCVCVVTVEGKLLVQDFVINFVRNGVSLNWGLATA